MSDRVVVVEISLLEAVHLHGMVRQFLDLIDATDVSAETPQDPAIARLVPDAYVDDAEASGEFRRLTGSDFLDRRGLDADLVLTTLSTGGASVAIEDLSEQELTTPVVIALDSREARAWMRVLAAIRLVLASRLGIESEDDNDQDDPRFGVYDWLGVRLEGLVQAIDASR